MEATGFLSPLAETRLTKIHEAELPLIGHFDKIHPPPVGKRDVSCVGPILKLHSHAARIHGKNYRGNTIMARTSVIINDPVSLFDLIHSSAKFHVQIIPAHSGMFQSNIN
jgi:hypothetical protein